MILQRRRRAPGDSDKLGVVFKLLPWKAALFSCCSRWASAEMHDSLLGCSGLGFPRQRLLLFLRLFIGATAPSQTCENLSVRVIPVKLPMPMTALL